MTSVEWIFSGIGTTILGGLVTYLFKRKSGKNKSNGTNIETNNTLNDSHVHSSVVASSSGNQTAINTVNIYNDNLHNQSNDNQKESKVLYKADVPILFIDDQKFEIVNYLKGRGWTDIKRIKDLKNFDDPQVIRAKIIFVDIKGVGNALNLKGEGLELAIQLKKRYRDKKIALYSSESKHDIFDNDLNLLDARIPKNADPIKFLSLVEQFMGELK